ncbi:O-linked N-acetylglucosamine transferase, SPINDLY family protein [Noviherbaspirillum aerium]|uniref:O-linked N-acetylglucosamine transferase, SPINDLY family protein n=1 Tax=Noviherbaspirillum aerium TaxID=2588497 RepID=UPI00124D6827|nr:tetratricopeptide repeat protein [Noviherbaspirillum aerium]
MMQDWKQQFAMAQAAAQQGNIASCLDACQQVLDAQPGNVDALLMVAGLLYSTGLLSAARQCLDQARALAPNDSRPLLELANIAKDEGNHAESHRLYSLLLRHLPDSAVVRRNALTSLEYNPAVPEAERLQQARAWGDWAMARAGGMRPRPPLMPEALDGSRPLRVGYVSADFCQHTVGLFVKDVIGSHRLDRVAAYTYSAGRVDDWVTATIRSTSRFRDVSALDDAALAERIRQDGIDVLVDLSGHTGGSRLAAFAHRPAPVQLSWLGYFATTGLAVIDAVLLDEWHAPPGIEAHFVEPIVRLPRGRFCYVPVPFAPAEVAPPPFEKNGFITFGCFNNTAKLNGPVIALWARILAALPSSRLVLKWRSLQDGKLRAALHATFSSHGIAPGRIELRGPSFHADLLKQYADIDIALDPFPFTGGLTSCEALWMGVPVVTWPQAQVVSRQTHAFLSAIGLPELSAADAGRYVAIACELAGDLPRLKDLRGGMRERMRSSPLCDVKGFTRMLEDAYLAIARRYAGHP